MRKKKRLASLKYRKFLLVIVCCLAVIGVVFSGIGVTLALMKSSEQRTNDFSIGDLRTELVEDFTPPTLTELDKSYKKEVSVKNTGETGAFVRVMVLPQILSKADNQGNQLLLPSTIAKELILDLDLAKWADGEDGYYYYLDILAPKEATSHLFTTVTLASSAMTDAYEEAELTIDVKVESINGTKWAYQDAWWNGDVANWSVKPLSDINEILKTKVID